MAGGTTIVDRLNKLSGKDATTIAKALENVEETGIGGGGGYSIDTKKIELYNGSFVADLEPQYGNAYLGSFDLNTPENLPDVLYITYDGVDYMCEKKEDDESVLYYGAPASYSSDDTFYDFSQYPFNLVLYCGGGYADCMCKDSGSHSAVLSVVEKEIKVTDDFTKASMLAVTGKASSEPMYKIEDTEVLYDDIIPDVVNAGDDEVWIVFAKEKLTDVYEKLEQYKTYVTPFIIMFDGVKYGSQMEYTDSTNSGRLALRFNNGDPDIYLCMDFTHELTPPNSLHLEDAEGNRIDLSTFGSHTLKLEIENETITTSEDFTKAIKSATSFDSPFVTVKVQVDSNNNVTNASHTFEQIQEAYNNGSMVTLYDQSNYVHTASVEMSMYGNSFVGIAFSSNGKIYAMKYDNNISGTWTVTKKQLQTV